MRARKDGQGEVKSQVNPFPSNFPRNAIFNLIPLFTDRRIQEISKIDSQSVSASFERVRRESGRNATEFALFLIQLLRSIPPPLSIELPTAPGSERTGYGRNGRSKKVKIEGSVALRWIGAEGLIRC